MAGIIKTSGEMLKNSIKSNARWRSCKRVEFSDLKIRGFYDFLRFVPSKAITGWVSIID